MSRGSRKCNPVPREVRPLDDLLERRWQLSIIYAALTGALRFSEFAEAVGGISPRMLSERLRDLEAAGLVQRTVIPSSPPTVEYRLTDRGRRLAPIVEAMRASAEGPTACGSWDWPRSVPSVEPAEALPAGAPAASELARTSWPPGQPSARTRGSERAPASVGLGLRIPSTPIVPPAATSAAAIAIP